MKNQETLLKNTVRKLNKLGLVAYNDTSTNDICNSIAIIWKGDGIKQKVFFPNSCKNNPNNEEFNTFQVQNQRIDNEDYFGETLEFFDIDDVIQYILHC